MSKFHNCIEEIRAGIIEDYELIDDDYLSIKIHKSRIVNQDDKVGTYRTGQSFDVQYYKLKKNKERSLRPIKWTSFISHIYCPFCGVKYDDLNDNKTQFIEVANE